MFLITRAAHITRRRRTSPRCQASLAERTSRSAQRNISFKKGLLSFRQKPFLMEAPPRFGLGHKGFADLCLTTWLWRRMERITGPGLGARRASVSRGSRNSPDSDSAPLPFETIRSLGNTIVWEFTFPGEKWSGLRVSNPPPRPWQGRALPNELNPQNFSG